MTDRDEWTASRSEVDAAVRGTLESSREHDDIGAKFRAGMREGAKQVRDRLDPEKTLELPEFRWETVLHCPTCGMFHDPDEADGCECGDDLADANSVERRVWE